MANTTSELGVEKQSWSLSLALMGAWANIPPKRNRKEPICFSPYLYRGRNLVERFFNKIKQCRRIATRRGARPRGTAAAPGVRSGAVAAVLGDVCFRG